MRVSTPQFDISLASSLADVQAAQRLRYDVFVTELGGAGQEIDHVARLEIDPYDNHSDHLILRDMGRDPEEQVVGVYRLMSRTQAAQAGQFSSETEYDLNPLYKSGATMIELSRSCLHPEYRGGTAMFHLWQALAGVIAERNIDILFGVASFHGANPADHAESLAMLFDAYTSAYPVTTRQDVPLPSQPYDKKRALQRTPALIKAYLRLGGGVGQGAFVDKAFNTTDVCMILDTHAMNARQKAIYTR